jgi:hypothetical protein
MAVVVCMATHKLYPRDVSDEWAFVAPYLMLKPRVLRYDSIRNAKSSILYAFDTHRIALALSA